MQTSATSPILIILATAWGPKFGGINAFNAEFSKSLGIVKDACFRLLCLVQTTSEADVEDAKRHSVQLLAYQIDHEQDFDGALRQCEQKLLALDLAAQANVVVLGHDDKTGPLALALNAALKKSQFNSRVALIHHMAHGAYQSYKKSSSRAGREKQAQQREMFRQADLCFAVGPLLTGQLQDLLATCPARPEVHMLVPGLDDPNDWGVAVADKPPNNFIAFVAGRLSAEDDRIKQAVLALRAFGQAVCDSDESSALRASPRLRMRGVKQEEEAELAKILFASAKREIARDFADYTDDRSEYFQSLASASVALMPSWHEGFGLVAWEAIACELPVILGEQSGVYRLLKRDCVGQGLGECVFAVNVAGNTPNERGEFNHTEADVNAITKHLLSLGQNLTYAKMQARRLRLELVGKYKWSDCAQTCVTALAKTFGLQLQSPLAPRDLVPLPKPVPPPPYNLVPSWLQLPLAQARRVARDCVTALAKAFGLQSSPPDLIPLPPPPSNLVPSWLQLPAAQVWQAAQDRPPSSLLLARDEIVPFDAVRAPQLARLIAWAENSNGVDIQLVTGEGGSGKTRLAYECARQLKTTWHSLWLGNTLPENWLAEWQQLCTQSDKPLLLVIDYAEARQDAILAVLQQLLETPSAKSSQKIRLLLIARSSGWWQQLPNKQACVETVAAWLAEKISVAQWELPAWPNDVASRAQSYHAALKAYAQVQGLKESAYLPDFSAAIFARPLYLHLAALAALQGQRPASARRLLEGQVRHEWQYWLRLNPHSDCEYEDWADAMACLALRQRASITQLTEAVTALGISAPGLIKGLQKFYPLEAGLAGLQPDLLAEHLLSERLAQARGSAILQWALEDEAEQEAVLEVLGRLCAETAPAAQEFFDLPRWRQVLATGLAHAWPNLGSALINAAHLAPAGLGGLLCHAWACLTPEQQERLAQRLSFPRYSSNLLKLVTLVEQLVLQHASDNAQRAGALHNLSISLAEHGEHSKRAEALAYAREALQIYRELARSQAAAYLPDVAMSLNNLAISLSAQGDAAARGEALACAREALQLYRELAHGQPAAYLPDVAMSLNNLANRLAEQGDAAARGEALACAREALQLYRELALSQAATYLPYVAGSLNNLANHLSEQGDAAARVEALACAREALQLYRELARSQAAAYLPDVAMSLNNLAIRLAEQGDAAARGEALACAREALQIRRELAHGQPAAYLPAVASSLNNLAVHLAEQGDAATRGEALACAREALELYRELALSQPAAYLPDVASSLNNLAIRLAEQGDAAARGEALACAREALQLYRELALSQAAAYLPYVASSLHNLAIRLAEQGDAAARGEALACAREAVALYFGLWQQMPAYFERYLQGTGRNFLRIAKENGLDGEAELKKLIGELTADAGE